MDIGNATSFYSRSSSSPHHNQALATLGTETVSPSAAAQVRVNRHPQECLNRGLPLISPHTPPPLSLIPLIPLIPLIRLIHIQLSLSLPHSFTPRHLVCPQVIAAIAAIDVPHGRWGTLIAQLCGPLQALDASEAFRVARLEAVGYVCDGLVRVVVGVGGERGIE